MSALDRIMAYKREEVAAMKAAGVAADLAARAADASPPRGFEAALRAKAAVEGFAVIAEIKRASPSKGLIRADFAPAAHARAYEAGGAACLSVLTDGPSFQGTLAHLEDAREACALPCLRKDFMVDPLQVVEARAHGADAVLIILAAVDDAMAKALDETARAFGMDVLVETHTEEEVKRANALGAALIGVNNRDLRRFVTRLETTAELSPLVGPQALLIAESGINTPQDISRLRGNGANAFLVGEALMRQPDLTEALIALRLT
jgi:indole-3-glycerol phosphate synthase